MKVVEIREKNIDELLKVVEDLKANVHQSQMDLMMNKSQKSSDIRNIKKDLARVMTVIEEKKRNA